MQTIGEIANKRTYKKKRLDINVIPNNMEKYMAFMLVRQLLFIYSFQFMSSSLYRLVGNLPRDAFKHTSQEFQVDELGLMVEKCAYPYYHMNFFDMFMETELPSKEDFHRVLNDSHISDEQNHHATKVWNTFRLKSRGNYHNLYLKSDVLLLTDVFKSFRKTCKHYYDSDPCHYFTNPALS